MKKAFVLFIFICCQLSAFSLRAQGFNWSVGGTGGSEGFAEAADPWGNVFETGFNNPAGGTLIFGSYTLTGYGDHATILVKFNPFGKVLWATSTNVGTSRPLSVAADQFGNAYLFAWYADTVVDVGPYVLRNPGATSGSIELFIAKYSPSGAVIWAKNICETVSGLLPYWSQQGCIAVNNADVYITSSFLAPVLNIGSFSFANTDLTGTTLDLFVAKLDSSGTVNWAKHAGSSGNDESTFIAVAPSGAAYITGNFASPTLSFGSYTLNYSGIALTSSVASSVFLVKYDATGNVLWAKSPAGNAYDGSVATDAAENAYIIGVYDTLDLNFGTTILAKDSIVDIYIAKYDASGNVDWVKKTTGNKNVGGYGISPDQCGNVWVTCGMEKDSFVIIDGNLYTRPADSRDPMFLAGWTPAGSYILANLLPTGGDDASNIALDGVGHVYVGGDSWGGPYTIGGVTLNDPNHAYEDICVAQFQSTFVKDSTLKSAIVCLKDSSDSALLIPPSGFEYYRWDNGSTASGRTVHTPGTYVLFATGKCGYGVLKETFSVNYGKLDTAYSVLDTSTCIHASSVLVAPAGYIAYAWSNGSNTQTDTIDGTGYYLAICTGTCTLPTLYDTFKVSLNNTDMYFSLGNDTAICRPDVLSVGIPGASYLWQDGSTASSYVASESNEYYVTAFKNGCFNSDTVNIYFLNLVQTLQDTLVCKDHPIEITLRANVPHHAKAIWSTGNTQDSITVNYPGNYWVTVTEAGCTGSDTMTLGELICACKATFPDAFTPNNDGKNDFFCPIIEKGCNLFEYTFCIYNRWGQLIFSTHDPEDKWDGKYFGVPQELGAYMYYVQYRVVGSYYKFVVKGDVTLVR